MTERRAEAPPDLGSARSASARSASAFDDPADAQQQPGPQQKITPVAVPRRDSLQGGEGRGEIVGSIGR